MDAFDADVLIYSAVQDHPLGRKVLELLRRDPGPGGFVGVGSVLLLPEILSKPLRDGSATELSFLAGVLGRLDLRPLDRATAEIATGLAARHNLRAADATHLATAIKARADRFVTNNTKDFPASVGDVSIVYPDQLPG
jgi:predicted nucleic acid-binding protein